MEISGGTYNICVIFNNGNSFNTVTSILPNLLACALERYVCIYNNNTL